MIKDPWEFIARIRASLSAGQRDMTPERRQAYLKIGAIVALGIVVLDYLIIEPIHNAWKAQSNRIAAVSAKIARGSQLLERENNLRGRWTEMLKGNLPAEVSTAEATAFKALSRWVNDSQIGVTSVTQQWQTREDGFDTFECRLSATGSQAAIGKFIYELETETTVPVNMEECELATRDARGSQLSFTARITFLRLKEPTKNFAP